MAAELAEFEIPWFQSLKLMVEAAGVTIDTEIMPSEGTEAKDDISHTIIQVRTTNFA